MACQEAAARELDWTRPPVGDLATDLVDCEACGGERGGECGVCHGLGMVTRPDPRDLVKPGTEPPEWFESVHEFLSAYVMIRDHGIDGLMRFAGIDRVDPVFYEAFQVFEAEKARLEHDARKAETQGRRKRTH
ncbi:MAG: hypothetical protein AMXMBFR58_29650 [Phycisphaerae bacterium]